jgi:Xaa-Pro dipeptidase
VPGVVEFDARISAVRGCMQNRGIDLLIAASSGQHKLDRPDPVVYLTGYRSLGESFVFLPREGEMKLVIDDAQPPESWEYASAKIATAGFDALPHELAERWLEALGNPQSFDNSLYAASGRKTVQEIERARRATAIAEQGMERLLELAGPGMPECQLAVELICEMKALGAEDNFLMLNAGPHNPAVMPSSSRTLEPGDILLTELSPSYEGQFTQICRTVSIGPPSTELQCKYDLVVRAMWAGIEAVRPGVPISHVCAAIDRVLQAEGYAEYCRPPHIRRRGHGLGSGSVEPGDVALDNQTILEENMIFIVHPNQYLPETGYLLCGEPVRVTRTGVETLSARTAALGVIGT